MALPLRGTAKSGTATNGGDVTLTFDTGAGAPQQGDVVILFGGHGINSATFPGPITAGYTLIHMNTDQDRGAWYKVMGASPDLTVQGEGGGNGSDAVAYAAFVLNGSLIDAAIFDATSVENNHGTRVPNAGAITTVTDGAWVIALGTNHIVDTSRGVPSGYTTIIGASANDSSDISIDAAYIEKATAGTEDPPAWSTWASGLAYEITLAIKPAAVTQTFSYTASGGMQSSGAASFARTVAAPVSGGLQSGGAAALAQTKVYLGSGGFTSSGAAVTEIVRLVGQYVASGGLSSSGAATYSTTAVPVVAGGFQSGGAALLARTFVYLGSGGLQAGGAAVTAPILVHPYVASGGLQSSGAALLKQTSAYVASGGLQSGGEAGVVANLPQTFSYTASGGATIAGDATTSYFDASVPVLQEGAGGGGRTFHQPFPLRAPRVAKPRVRIYRAKPHPLRMRGAARCIFRPVQVFIATVSPRALSMRGKAGAALYRTVDHEDSEFESMLSASDKRQSRPYRCE